MFFDGEKAIQGGLQGDEGAERTVDAAGRGEVAGLEGAPQGYEGADEIGAGHGADDAALVGVHESDAASAFEDSGAAAGGIPQFGEALANRGGLRFKLNALRTKLVEQAGLEGDGEGLANVAASILDNDRNGDGTKDALVVFGKGGFANAGGDGRNGHEGGGTEVFGIPGETLGGMSGLGTDTDDNGAATAVGQADVAGKVVALLGGKSECFGDHGHDHTVGAFARQPVQLHIERGIVDRLILVKWRLENGQDAGEGGGAGIHHIESLFLACIFRYGKSQRAAARFFTLFSMPTPRPFLLILGAGSIGERHLRVFQSTGRCEVAFVEPMAERRAAVAERYGVRGYATWEEAMEREPVTAALIASPAPFHVPTAITLAQRGLDLLIEKPLSLSLEGVEKLEAVVRECGVRAAVAFVYRALPALQQLRAAVLEGRFGAPVQVQVVSGQHFPFYRPAYREIYYADPAMGGGAIQDMLPHHVNAVEWIVGSTDRVVVDAAHAVLEGVTVEDTVNFLTRHGPVMGCFTANQHQPVNEFSLTVICERGAARWEMKGHRWLSAQENGGEWKVEATFTHERDDFYRLQAEAFLDCLENDGTALCPLADGVTTLRTTLAMLESVRSQRWVAVG